MEDIKRGHKRNKTCTSSFDDLKCFMNPEGRVLKDSFELKAHA